ncbi:PREDICTED: coiled-coil domain-containing protein 11 [Chaetura pelagica]|uniref:coiled-coil domain-containing protein 11 n=1 Tax=Chaetura pelagica TaxID=8897 RepID=UPI000523EFE6|nr:PREDICTED: coiled-coil domain-containing protein 11 [Chaetura pelagica]
MGCGETREPRGAGREEEEAAGERLRAKPPKGESSEHFVFVRRQKDKEVQEYSDFAKEFHQYCNIYKWHKSNQHKWLHGDVQRKVDAKMQEYLAGLHERRERLRELLEGEESQYLVEIDSLEETVQGRQQKMRETVSTRRTLVLFFQLADEKREQQFRQQCDELRLLLMKKHQKEVCEDRLAQVALKEELKKQQQKEEQMFAELWKEDRLAKEKREVKEMQRLAKQQREVRDGLSAQVAELNAQQEEARRLKEEEAQLLEEEQQLLQQGKEQLQKEELQKQKECRDMLLSAAQEKQKRLDEEKQDELALELKILEKCLQDPQKDTEEKTKRKQELLREQQTYLAHLAQQLEEERQREQEAERAHKEEIEKVWAKKAEKMRAEKEARKQLLKDVMDTWQWQIEQKVQRNVKEQEELAEEKKLLDEAISELNHIEEKKYARKLKEAKEYQEHLRAQIAHREQARDAEEEEKQREYESAREEERAYQERIQNMLSNPWRKPAAIHPFRRQVLSNSLQQNLH